MENKILFSTLSYNDICSLKNKKLKFNSDCEFFNNFEVIGKVIDIQISNNNEYLLLVYNGTKNITIGSNMKNLSITYL